MMDCSTVIAAAVTATTTTKHPKDAIAATALTNICNSESFSVFPSMHHELVSANSIELNGATSLSDDSGVPLTTNSSISSGDSYRLGMCKFEIELVESDGEVSQFDSLDNCSESGMSAENFNTLKKGPLALIDPPPEFQDSPQTTLVRSTIKRGSGYGSNLRRWTSSQSSFEHLKDHVINDSLPRTTTTAPKINGCDEQNGASDGDDDGDDNSIFGSHDERTLRELYAASKHLYSSDSILNIHIDNIYDEPNNVLSSSLGNSAAESQSPLPSPPPPVSIVKIKRTLCPFYQDHTRYFKAIPSEQDNLTNSNPATATTMKMENRFNDFSVSDIHDYDVYSYGFRWNTIATVTAIGTAKSAITVAATTTTASVKTTAASVKTTATTYHQYDYTLQRKPISSPLSSSHHSHYHNHIYHGSIGGGCNRPNSRNSLNGRLSSSHNSLSTSSANKPDDSIFITQAMSHDTLLTREITDFYNVPIDSDIYAFPVDMINAGNNRRNDSKYQTLKDKGAQQSLIFHNYNHKDNGMKHLQEKNNNNNNNNSNYNNGNRNHKTNCKQIMKHKKRFNCLRNTCSTKISTAAIDTEIIPCHHPILTYSPTLLSTFNATHDKNLNNKRQSTSMQMNLNGINQFYNTVYSETKSNNHDGIMQAQRHLKNPHAPQMKCSNEISWNISPLLNFTTHGWDDDNSVGICIDGGGDNNNALNNTNTTITMSTMSTKHVDKLFGPIVGSCIKSCKNQKDNFLLADKDRININNNNNNNNHNHNHNIKGVGNINDLKHISKVNVKQQQQQQHSNIIDISSNSKANIVVDKKIPFSLNLKEKFCSIFRFRRNSNRCRSSNNNSSNEQICQLVRSTDDNRKRLQFRALPPLPNKGYDNNAKAQVADTFEHKNKNLIETTRPLQFTSSIEKVKDYGWYWGPLSSEAAEKVLSNEPDGSFIVRDSSDDHYIFSLSFKLNNCVRHVRIEQDQGTFSFGCYAKFKSQTITEFVEKAVEHSRSGRYLFFLHRRPEHGPLRVQLTNPVSRFKHVQSLQHICRFVILKVVVRKDLIQTLPLPRRLLDYLNYKHCYSEQIETDSSTSQVSEEEFL